MNPQVTSPAAHDWRLAPIALGAFCGAIIGTAGGGWWPWLAAGGVVVALACVKRWPWLAMGVCAFALLACGSAVLASQRAESKLAVWAGQQALVKMEVTVITEPRPRPVTAPLPPSASVPVVVHWVDGRGERAHQRLPARLTASGEQYETLLGLRPGARVVVTARLAPSRPGEDVAALARIRKVERESRAPDPAHRLAAWLRAGLRAAVAHAPSEQRALVPSLVVGDTSLLTRQMEHDFRITGLTHLMAVSGSNLALMLGVMLALFRWVGVRGWAVRIAAVGVVGMFVVVCGPDPSVLRAAAMGLVALAAMGAGKGRRSIRGLLVAVLVLVTLDPWLARAPGFWLSSAACLGIVVIGPWCLGRLTHWAPRWLAEAWAIPLAAQIPTLPIVTGLSGEVSVVGLVANVLAGPFVGPTTILGFAAACTSWYPPLSALLGWCAGWGSQPILWTASVCAGLPGTSLEWFPGWLGIITTGAVSLALLGVLGPVLRRLWACALVLLGLLVGLLVHPSPPGWPGRWDVAFCDVGQGDATVIRAGQGAAVLVDAGPDPSAALRCLQELGIEEVPLVILTHYHADHIGGFEAVIDHYHPRLVLTSRWPQPESAAVAVRLAAGDAQVRPVQPGEQIAVGEMRWTSVSSLRPSATVALDGAAGESSVENDSSVIGVAQVAGLRVVLAGDAEPAGQAAALRQARELGISLAAQVLKLPHHGSSRQDERFFSATTARLAVASAGEGNAYGHPAARALSLATRLGMTVVRTDEDGTVTVTAEGGLQVRRKEG